MTPIEWALTPFRKYADFKGRATRPEYWWFFLLSVVGTTVAVLLDRMLGFNDLASSYGPFYLAYSLAMFVPSLAVAVRRLHDTDRSGWWLLLAIVPFAGIAVIVFLCLESIKGPNQFGPPEGENLAQVFE